MKKILAILSIYIFALAFSLFGHAPIARAATANNTITVSVKLTNESDKTDLAATTSVSLAKDSKTLDTKLLAATGEPNTKEITFNPVEFSDIDAGTYKACVVATDICQTVQKGADTLQVGLSGTITKDVAAKMSTATAADAEEKCYAGAGPLGWIVCSLFDYMQKTISFVETQVIVPFLHVPPLSTTNADGSASTVFAIWQVFRGVADAAFILIFLFIIFAQTASIGVGSLTIKRMLPRLVAAAIFVQFSYLFCSLAIDIINILGGGISQIVDGILKSTGAAQVDLGSIGAGLGLTALAIGAIAAAGAVVSGAIFILLIGAFFGVLGVFLTLIARQIIITLLIILSPIAFILWILPNTQSGFDFWRKNFTKILLMYPMIVLLFAASKIVAVAATSTAGNGMTTQVAALIGLAAAVVPLFLIPMTFKSAGSLMATASGMMNKFAAGAKAKTESSQNYERLQEWQDARKKMLSAGVGVTMPGSGKEPVLGGKRSANVGRLLGGNVSNMTKTAQANSLRELRGLQAKKSKEMEELGFDPDAYGMVSRGRDGAAAMIADAQADLVRKRLAGDPAEEIAIAERKVSDLQASHQLASRFFGHSVAQSAAALKLGEMGVLDEKDRLALAERSQSTGGQQYGKLIWKEARFKAGQNDPVLGGTTLDGHLDVKGIAKGLAQRPPDKLAGISKGGWENIARLGILDKIAPEKRAVLIDASSNNPTSEAGAEVIVKYQEATAALAGNFTVQTAFTSSHGAATPHKYELLNDGALLGGLIADGSGNTPNEQTLRLSIRNELLSIVTKTEFANRIEENKPLDQISDDDFDDFMDYRKYWLSRVDSAGNKRD